AAGRGVGRKDERQLRTEKHMSEHFADLPDAIANTEELSARLEFTLADLGYQFPKYPVPAGENMNSLLRKRTDEGFRNRYAAKDGEKLYQRAEKQIQRELALIEKLNLDGYCL